MSVLATCNSYILAHIVNNAQDCKCFVLGLAHISPEAAMHSSFKHSCRCSLSSVYIYISVRPPFRASELHNLPQSPHAVVINTAPPLLPHFCFSPRLQNAKHFCPFHLPHQELQRHLFGIGGPDLLWCASAWDVLTRVSKEVPKPWCGALAHRLDVGPGMDGSEGRDGQVRLAEGERSSGAGENPLVMVMITCAPAERGGKETGERSILCVSRCWTNTQAVTCASHATSRRWR